MRVSRRDVIGVGGAAVAAGLAGCVGTGPFRQTTLAVSIRAPFETDSSVSVPLTVEVFVQNVDSDDVALRDVDLVLLDDEREALAEQRLGDFSWQNAGPARRDSKEYDDGVWGNPTAYWADWTLEPRVLAAAVPEVVTFRVGEVRFGDDESAASLFVGEARATTPPPELTVTAERLDRDRPLPETLDPDDFSSYEVRPDPREDGPLLPRTTVTPSPTPGTDGANETATPRTRRW